MTGRSSRSKGRRHSRGKRRTSSSSRESRRDSVSGHRVPSGSNRHDSPSDRRDRSSRRRIGSQSPRSSRKHNRDSRAIRDSSRDVALDRILNRLEAIEARLPISVENDSPSRPINQSRLLSTPLAVPTPASEPGSGVAEEVTEGSDMNTSGTKDTESSIVGALTALFKAKSHNFYISPFDPNVHDFDVWCAEVDRARLINNWDDRECLGRVGSCLKGDAKSWLNDWVTNDRSWSGFKLEFRSLCPRNIDIASVLYDVMSTNSNKYSTYAEYARKSLLRLNIVKGLSDELKAAIVVRGIADPQIKAAATNAKLLSKDLVEFLSVYVKPKYDPRHTNNTVRPSGSSGMSHSRKREAPGSDDSKVTCHACGKLGHKKWNCPKKLKNEATTSNKGDISTKPAATTSSDNKSRPVKHCTFCNRTGHLVESCFQKQRSDSGDKKTNEVNFCLDSTPNRVT